MFCRCFLLVLIGLCWASCSQKKERVVKKSFYYWKSQFFLTKADQTALDSLGVQAMYLKFFDVDLNAQKQPVPRASVQFQSAWPASLELIPSVFITNRTLMALDSLEVIQLADRIVEKIRGLSQANQVQGKVREIQLDCDWSTSTARKYFLLLKQVRYRIAPVRLSATIRLHQFRHWKKAGVPPVDKGLLMFYNMSDVRSAASANSILDLPEARKYLTSQIEYPLPLDVALPLFSWGVLFRQEQFIGILNALDEEEAGQLVFLQKTADHHYVSTADTVYGNIYLRNGDRIRLEVPTTKDLLEAVALTKPLVRPDSAQVAFFHWNQPFIQHYTYETLETVYHHYR